jgi:hypothetical protein
VNEENGKIITISRRAGRRQGRRNRYRRTHEIGMNARYYWTLNGITHCWRRYEARDRGRRRFGNVRRRTRSPLNGEWRGIDDATATHQSPDAVQGAHESRPPDCDTSLATPRPEEDLYSFFFFFFLPCNDSRVHYAYRFVVTTFEDFAVKRNKQCRLSFLENRLRIPLILACYNTFVRLIIDFRTY